LDADAEALRRWSDAVAAACVAALPLTTPALTRLAAGGTNAPYAYALLMCSYLKQAARSGQTSIRKAVVSFAAAYNLPTHVMAVALAEAVHAGILPPQFLTDAEVA
jgi:hypothetical protein